MQQPKNTQRLLRALSKQGLDVSYEDNVYKVRLDDRPEAPVAEVLLPPDFPIEGKAFKQLANLTTLAHPGGGQVDRTFELTRAGANYTESDLGLTGVDCITLRSERRIEEAPAAYKSIDRVIDTQVSAGMVEVVAKMRPILTFKA